MTEPSSSQAPEVSKPSNERLYLLIALGLLTLAAVYFFYKSQISSSTANETNLKLTQDNANLNEKLQELQAAQLSLQEHQQVAKSKLHEVQAQYKEVSATLTTLQGRIDNWQKSADTALDSELGKRIASDPTLLAKYEAIVAQKRPSVDIARQLQTRLEELQAPLDRAKELKQGAYSPTQQFVTTLAALEEGG